MTTHCQKLHGAEHSVPFSEPTEIKTIIKSNLILLYHVTVSSGDELPILRLGVLDAFDDESSLGPN